MEKSWLSGVCLTVTSLILFFNSRQFLFCLVLAAFLMVFILLTTWLPELSRVYYIWCVCDVLAVLLNVSLCFLLRTPHQGSSFGGFFFLLFWRCLSVQFSLDTTRTYTSQLPTFKASFYFILFLSWRLIKAAKGDEKCLSWEGESLRKYILAVFN